MKEEERGIIWLGQGTFNPLSMEIAMRLTIKQKGDMEKIGSGRGDGILAARYSRTLASRDRSRPAEALKGDSAFTSKGRR